jgi:hypothetical protein
MVGCKQLSFRFSCTTETDGGGDRSPARVDHLQPFAADLGILGSRHSGAVESPGVEPALSAEDLAQLIQLEESMWLEATRYDQSFMHAALAPDFFEFGRSGKRHSRDAVIAAMRQEIRIVLPLRDLAVRLFSNDTAQVTYISETENGGRPQLALRSSIWSKTSKGWQLRFHQGTPIPDASVNPCVDRVLRSQG